MRTSLRKLLLAGGLAAFLLGVGAVAAPGLLAFGLDVAVVPLLGLLALLLAVRTIQARRNAAGQRATTPDPEVLEPTPPPGDDIDETLADFLGAGRTYYGSYTHRGLREAAIAALTRYEGYTKEQAEERLQEGAWTDDPHAASFFQGAAPPEGLASRLRRTIGLESLHNRQVRHTIDAIAEITGLSFDTSDSSLLDRFRRRLTGTPSVRQSLPEPIDGPEGLRGTVRRETGHWTGVNVVAFLGLGVGLLAERPAVLLVGALGIGYAAYASATRDPDVSLSLDRSLSAESPLPEDDVEVTVTVTNEGERTVPDLRLVDGVPPSLAVAEGSPRLGTVLRPGESTTLSYTVTARRGRHEFRPMFVVARDLTGGREREFHLSTATSMTCTPTLEPLPEPFPLRARAARYAGQVQTASGGSGVEFYATREYRRGDPLGRIDWNRHARTGELATLEFREERAATVVVLVDTRDRAYAAPSPHEEHAVDRSVAAAGRTLATLLSAGNRVGLAAVGDDDCWLAPSTGSDHRLRARELLTTHPGFASSPREPDTHLFRWKRLFRRRLAAGTQVVLFSPLCDEAPARIARQLEEYGYPVTVVSPDPTAERTPGHRLARTGRRIRITELRSAGVPVVDWSWGTPVEAALARRAGERR